MTAIAVEGSRVALTFSAPLRAKGTISPATFGMCHASGCRRRRLHGCHHAGTVDGAVVRLTAPADALPADTEVWLRYSGGSESDHLHDQYNSSAIVPAIAGHRFRTPEAAPTPPGVADCDRGRRNGDAHVRPRSRCRLGSHGCCVLSKRRGSEPGGARRRRCHADAGCRPGRWRGCLDQIYAARRGSAAGRRRHRRSSVHAGDRQSH